MSMLILLVLVIGIIIYLIVRSVNKRRSATFGERAIREYQRTRSRASNHSVSTQEGEDAPRSFDSFYIDEDGTIVKGQKRGNGLSSSSSIIHSPDEQKEAILLIQKSADAGYAEAQYYLGLCYEQGTVVPKDIDIAKKWYGLAADQGNPQAQYRLGLLMINKV